MLERRYGPEMLGGDRRNGAMLPAFLGFRQQDPFIKTSLMTRECVDFTRLGKGIRSLRLYSVVSEAFRSVVVYHSNCLHERVADSRADEPEASFTQLFTHSIGFSSSRRNLTERFGRVPDRPTADKSPHVTIERTEFFPRLQELFSVCDSRLDFETVAYDARVMEESLDILLVVARDLRGVEGVESFAIVLTFVENGLPIESCLSPLQCKELEQDSVVMHRDSPFLIMVVNHERTVAVGRPLTPAGRSFLQFTSTS